MCLSKGILELLSQELLNVIRAANHILSCSFVFLADRHVNHEIRRYTTNVEFPPHVLSTFSDVPLRFMPEIAPFLAHNVVHECL